MILVKSAGAKTAEKITKYNLYEIKTWHKSKKGKVDTAKGSAAKQRKVEHFVTEKYEHEIMVKIGGMKKYGTNK